MYLIALKQPSPPARFYLCKAAAPSPCRQTLQILPTSGLKLHIPLPGLTLLSESAQITFLGSSAHLCLPTFPTGGSGSALLLYYYPPACQRSEFSSGCGSTEPADNLVLGEFRAHLSTPLLPSGLIPIKLNCVPQFNIEILIKAQLISTCYKLFHVNT